MRFLVVVLVIVSQYSARASPSVKGGRLQDQSQQYERPSRLYEGTLKQVHIIFRHGDRAPIATYPKDPNINHEWTFGRGQLTDIGKRQHYELGNYLRNRYSQFLTTDPREVQVRSSGVERCLASVQSNLAGFFRPTGKWIWNRELPWQPVPIQTAPEESDWLLNEHAVCPAAEKIRKSTRTPQSIRYSQKYQRLYDYVTEHSGQTVNDPRSLISVYDVTRINKLHNLTAQPWSEPIWPEFTQAYDEGFAVEFSHKPYLRLKAGPLVGEVLNQMKKYDQEDHSTVHPKAFMYSTHDSIVTAFLSTIGVHNGLQVPYAAAVLLELHEHNRPVNRYTVRIYYRNTTDHEPFQLVVPSCQPDCPLGELDRMLHEQDVIPSNIKEECHGPEKETQRQDLVGGSQQQGQGCCCCNQCGSSLPPLTTVDTEAQIRGQTGAKMQDLLVQMRELMEQHRRHVDRSVQELVREMEDSDQEVQRIRTGYRESRERISQQSIDHRNRRV